MFNIQAMDFTYFVNVIRIGANVNISIVLFNKIKVSNERDIITADNLINDKYLLLQKGKKDYTLIVAQ